MEKEQYIRRLSSYQKLSLGLKAYLKFTLQEMRFERSEKNDLSKEEYGGYCYLAKGSARIYRYDEKSEQEITLIFLKTGHIIPDTCITAENLRRTFYIEFLENTVLYSIPENHIDNIHKLFREAVKLTTAINADTWAITITALTDLKLMEANQRLEKLLETFPDIFSITAVKNIASYLGIHPTTLSAMRKNLIR